MVLFCLGSEKKEVRRLAAWGVINVVKVTWLEDCNRAKKEVKVSPTHMATELLLKGKKVINISDLDVFHIIEVGCAKTFKTYIVLA